MQQFVTRIETSATVKERIKELQAEHMKDLQSLYSHCAADYKTESLDFFKSIDDTQYLEPDVRDRQITEGYRRLEVRVLLSLSSFRAFAHANCFQQLWELQQFTLLTSGSVLREYNEMRHAYLNRFLELQTQLREIEKRENKEKMEAASKWPQTIAQFEASPKDVKLRIARHLLGTRAVQERMMDEFNWSSREVEPLLTESRQNVCEL